MIVATLDDRLEAKIRDAWELPGVRAGSGLAWWGDRLAVIQDDAFAVALVDPRTRAVELRPLLGTGAELSKAEKPDFEGVFTDEQGRLVAIGSGSKPNRRQWARFGQEATELVDATAFYLAVAAALGEAPNLEGCVARAGGLRVFHRAAGQGDRPNVVLELAYGALPDEVPRVLSQQAFDLGSIAHVKLTFTDAAPLADGRVMYLAAAEDTPNAVDDGRVVGAAVGVLDGATARWAPLEELDGSPSTRKVEGLALLPGGREVYMVTDADDPALPATLLRVVLRGAW